MIFGSIEPEDADVFFEFRVVEFSGELHDLGFRDRVIGLGAGILSLSGEDTNEDDERPDDAVFYRVKEDFEYFGAKLLLYLISGGDGTVYRESRLCLGFPVASCVGKKKASERPSFCESHCGLRSSW